MLSTTEKVARLRLIRTETVGPIAFRALLARYGSAEAALEAIPQLARRGGRTAPLRIPSKAAAERELAALARFSAQPLFWGDAGYPRLLAATEDAPPVLLAKGALHLLERPTLALVGARNASSIGRQMAERLAREIAERGVVIVSGLARGIDAAAHRGALATGTIAVVAGGLDVNYPRENAALQEAIAEQGLLVGEEPLGVQPQARHFPKRNRIISGLALAVLVVEAAERSGSLITARLAAAQGREVMAVPGSPLDPRSRGANALIRSGAALIECAEDVIEILSQLSPPLEEPDLPDYRAAATPPRAEVPEGVRTRIRTLLSPTPTLIDDIVRDSGASTGDVLTVLLELELAGLIERHAGARVALSG
ncbi:MAG: DNA-protecting protein DprA, partial [Alphaproteobacteria bacterium]